MGSAPPDGSSGGSTKNNNNCQGNNNTGSATSSAAALMTDQLKHMSMVAGSYPPVSSSSNNRGDGAADNNNNNNNNVLDAFIKQQHQRQRLSSGESIDPSFGMLSFGASTSADTMFGHIDDNSHRKGAVLYNHRFNQQVDIISSQDMAAELEEDLPFIWTPDDQSSSTVISHHHNSGGITSKASQGGMKKQQQYSDSSSQYVSSNQSVDANIIANNMLQRQKGRSLSSVVSDSIDSLMFIGCLIFMNDA